MKQHLLLPEPTLEEKDTISHPTMAEPDEDHERTMAERGWRPRVMPSYDPYSDAHPPDQPDPGSAAPKVSINTGMQAAMDEDQALTAQLQLEKARREREEAEAELAAFERRTGAP